MNLNQQEATVFVVLGAMLAFFGALSIRLFLSFLQRVKQEYQYLRHPRLIEYSEMRACTDPHQWVDVVLALRGLEAGKYKVCQACGSIMGHPDKMMSDEAIHQMNEGLQLLEQKRELERQVQIRISQITESYVDQYIRRNFPQEINDVHFAEKLRGLGKYAVTALADASEKVAAELTAQDELDARYKDWPGKIKGNA